MAPAVQLNKATLCIPYAFVCESGCESKLGQNQKDNCNFSSRTMQAGSHVLPKVHFYFPQTCYTPFFAAGGKRYKRPATRSSTSHFFFWQVICAAPRNKHKNIEKCVSLSLEAGCRKHSYLFPFVNKTDRVHATQELYEIRNCE
jgi:hypothetical protein